MTIDDDRRGMAARLRGLETAELDEDGVFCDRGEVEDALGLATDDGAWYGFLGVQRLADLIDRPTCEMRGHPGARHVVCTRCGAFVRRDAVTDCTSVIPAKYCPNCGAKIGKYGVPSCCHNCGAEVTCNG